MYYVPCLNNYELYWEFEYLGDMKDIIYQQRGMIFATKEEAIEASKKMLAVLEAR